MADELFLAHMAEHLLIADVGALLLVLGLTGPVLQPVLRIRAFDRLRVLTHPLVALPLWALSLYAWHLEALYVGSVDHAALHALQHACFVGFGMAMWMPLFGPLPKPPWFGNAARLVYILAVRLTGAVLANVLVWSGAVLYPRYAGDRGFGISPLEDQNAAGAIMMVEGSILTIGLFCWLFLRTAREGEERQALLDLAAAQGVALTDRRAARAVAAGRGAELRRRLEAGHGG
jgi:cytochrome c oxidase assembly factor CtaG